MTTRVHRLMAWFRLQVLPLVWVAGLAMATGATHAQSWPSTCHDCHGTVPSVQNGTTDGGGSTTLGLGESWMASAATLKTRANGISDSTAMSGMNQTTADGVWAYLVQLRDGTLTGTAPSFPNTAVGSFTNQSVTVTLRNYRAVAVTYTLSASGTDFSLVSASTGSCAAASSSTTPTTCTASATIRFQPTAAVSRSGILRATASTAFTNALPPSLPFTATGTAAAVPGYSASPTTLSFTAPVGGSDLRSVTISNPGTASLSLSSITVSPDTVFTRDASSNCSAGGSVAAGGACTLAIRFSPSAAGGATGSVSITHNAAGSPGTVALNGTGTMAGISASPSPLDFGSVQVGSSPSTPITIRNTGTAALTLSNTGTLGGLNAGDFAVASTTCVAGSPMAANATCTITVRFTPVAAGTRSAALSVASDAPTGTLVVNVSGTGTLLAQPVVGAPSSAFPDTVIGETAAQRRTVTIQNPRATAVGYSLAGNGDFIIATESCPAHSVPAGATCSIAFDFRPAAGAAGLRSATLPVTFTGSGGDADPGTANVTLSGLALLPLQLSSTALTLSATVGGSATSSTTLTNLGSSAITLATLAFTGPNASDYSVDATGGCQSAAVIAPSANCTLVARFSPTSSGVNRTAMLPVAYTIGGSAGAGSPQSISLSGTASNAPLGTVAVSTSTLAFADTVVGASTMQALDIQNTGSAPLTFTALALGGAQAGDFSRGGTCAVGVALVAGARCSVDVSFAPTTAGVRSATLALNSDATNAGVVVVLSGTGRTTPTPQLTLSPGSLEFGSQSLGGIYPARTLRLDNTGTATLAIASIAAEGAAFSVDASGCGAELASGNGCDLSVAFAPTAVQAYSGAVVVTSNASGSPQRATLAGQGTVAVSPVLSWDAAPSTLDFGTVVAGEISAVRTLSLRNAGPGGATISLLNAVGVDGAVFSVAGGSCAAGSTVAEASICTVDIRFTPATSGARQAALQVASNGSAPQTVVLKGVGLGHPSAALALSASSLDFGSVRLGATSAPLEVVLRNSGSGTLMVSGYQVSGPFAVQARSCPAAPFVLAAGSACTLALVYAPQSQGTATGVFEVQSDAASSATGVALSGLAEPAPVVSSGGCSVAQELSPLDPTLWILSLAAGVIVWRRRRGVFARCRQ